MRPRIFSGTARGINARISSHLYSAVSGHRKRSSKGIAFARWVQVQLPQPTMRTEKDIGSESPETTTVSWFCYAIFQGEIQKISFPKNDLWGGIELSVKEI